MTFSFVFDTMFLLIGGVFMFDKLKTGLFLVVIGEVLYLLLEFLARGSNISDFVYGILFGISMGVNLVGVFVLAFYIFKNGKSNKSDK